MRRIAGKFDALLTMDRHIEFQQNIHSLPFEVVLIRAPSNRIRDLRSLVPAIREALSGLQPGLLSRVGR